MFYKKKILSCYPQVLYYCNLLDYAYYKKHYKLIGIDLSKQTKLKNPQQINFIGKRLRNTGATMFFIIEKSEENTFNFSQNSVTVI